MIQLDDLLKPCSPMAPAGASMRYEPIYDQIKEARREDLMGLPQGIWVTKPKRANWPVVESLCTEVLIERSKDVQVAAWLTEAWTMLYGMEGLAAGVHLVTLMTQQYWPSLFPVLEADFGKRAAPYTWLNERFSERLGSIPISHTPDGLVHTYAMWIDAVDAEDQARRGRAGAVPKGQPTLEAIQKAQAKTPTEFYRDLMIHAELVLEYLSTLQDFLDGHMPSADVSLYRLQDRIQKIQGVLKPVLAERGKLQLTPPPAPLSTDKPDLPLLKEGLMPMTPSDHETSDMLHTRAEAYHQLEQIANYLATIEPHSPTPYLIRKAVTWGRMPLDQLMADLMKDEGSYAQFMKLLGLK